MTLNTIGRCRDCQHWHDGKGQHIGTGWKQSAGCHVGHIGRFMSHTVDGRSGPVKIFPPKDGSGYCWRFEAKEPR